MANINRFFQETLGANLSNPRWSWGAVDPLDNRVFLRVWQDQIESSGSVERVQVDWTPRLSGSAGYNERGRHLDLVRAGAQAFGVVCIADKPNKGEIRHIKSFDSETLLVLGEFTSDGRGVFAEIVDRIPMISVATFKSSESSLTTDLQSIFSSRRKLKETVVQALIDARVGQGGFRVQVLTLWHGRCCVTGSQVRNAIRASHIKPWRHSTNEERIDPYNGLPLVATMDALFDVGLISFTDNGDLMISPDLSSEESSILGLTAQRLRDSPHPRTIAYLNFHRDQVYKG